MNVPKQSVNNCLEELRVSGEIQLDLDDGFVLN
jgi:hypothetical protein